MLCTGGANDHLDCDGLLDLLDSFLRHLPYQSAAVVQLPTEVAISLHDAVDALDRLPQQLPQPVHLRRNE